MVRLDYENVIVDDVPDDLVRNILAWCVDNRVIAQTYTRGNELSRLGMCFQSDDFERHPALRTRNGSAYWTFRDSYLVLVEEQIHLRAGNQRWSVNITGIPSNIILLSECLRCISTCKGDEICDFFEEAVLDD